MENYQPNENEKHMVHVLVSSMYEETLDPPVIKQFYPDQYFSTIRHVPNFKGQIIWDPTRRKASMASSPSLQSGEPTSKCKDC
ncbi:hypothetical protein GXP67_21160 [Rhodocytophaga rosea]|uniref:Uncharacterized protein n=1 Tax=Rhodocytophaga rosea TaxID=2704465 RepID=A0A6C0GMW8_9BACT|nr:hypothetical protein [Rhodocytophaga rosea]QHT68980.1 hypothetical protein GXP67_21160 [Rhodocytophaga rosea]